MIDFKNQKNTGKACADEVIKSTMRINKPAFAMTSYTDKVRD